MMQKILVENNRIVTKKQNGNTLYCVSSYNPMQNQMLDDVQWVDKKWLCKNSVFIANARVSKEGRLSQCKDKYTQLYEDFVRLFRKSLREGFCTSWFSLTPLVCTGMVSFDTSNGFNFNYVDSLKADKCRFAYGIDEFVLEKMHEGKNTLATAAYYAEQACGLLILWGVDIQKFLCKAYTEAENQEKENHYRIIAFYNLVAKDHMLFSVKTKEDVDRITRVVKDKEQFQEVNGDNALYIDTDIVKPLHDLYFR